MDFAHSFTLLPYSIDHDTRTTALGAHPVRGKGRAHPFN